MLGKKILLELGKSHISSASTERLIHFLERLDMNEWMNESIFHNSKLQNQLLKVSEKFNIHFLQFINMRLLLTANKLTESSTYLDLSYRKLLFTNWFLREAWYVNMFSSYMVGVNEQYVKGKCYFLEKNTGKENDRRIFLVLKSKIRILERMKKG